MKRICVVLLLLALLGSLCLPAGAFSDVTDPATVRNVDALQMLGVVGGYGDNTFRPQRGLSRAEFCTMAVKIMGEESQTAMYLTRTIFPDVRANHWARGYINLAVAGERKIIAGMPDGTFRPDEGVTYGQAATILLRVLGYSDTDAGMLWPQGYVALAEKTGLAGDLRLDGYAMLDRQQAAYLFASLLTTETKDGGVFANLLGNERKDVVVLDVQEKPGEIAVKTPDGDLTVKGDYFPRTARGQKGWMLLDDKGQILTFLPDDSSQKTVSLTGHNASWIAGSDGVRYVVTTDTPVYSADGVSTYGQVWMDLQAGDVLTLYLDSGKVTGLYFAASAAQEAVVVTGTASAAVFSPITGQDANYTIFKNGRQIGLDEIRPYDVATYDGGVLRISDNRVTVQCENMIPNEDSPLYVTAYGNTFPVLYGAMESVSAFHTGDEMTLLFTADGRVAGAVSPDKLRCDAIGVITRDGGSTATVTLAGSELAFQGVLKPTGTASEADWSGRLVRVYRDQDGKTCLSRIYDAAAPGSLSVKDRRIGQIPVRSDAALYERVGSGVPRPIEWKDLDHLTTVPVSRIAYCHTADGEADLLVLLDVTGDNYEYGILQAGTVTRYDWGEAFRSHTAAVRNSNSPQGGTAYYVLRPVEDGVMGGVAAGEDGNAAAIVTLTGGEIVSRTDFRQEDDKTFVSCNGRTYRVAENVQCYNARGKSWFSSLSDARGFSDRLKIYRDPIGEKVRLVVVE